MGSVQVPDTILREANRRKKDQPHRKQFDLCVDVYIEKKLHNDPLTQAFRNLAKGKAMPRQKKSDWGGMGL